MCLLVSVQLIHIYVYISRVYIHIYTSFELLLFKEDFQLLNRLYDITWFGAIYAN